MKEKINKDIAISQQIMKIYRDNHESYGYRRITLELRKNLKINHKKVQRMMNILVIKRKSKRQKYRTYQGEIGRIAYDLSRSPNFEQITRMLAQVLTRFEGETYFTF